MSVLVYLNENKGKISKASLEAGFVAADIAKKLNTNAIAITAEKISTDVLKEIENVGVKKVYVVETTEAMDNSNTAEFIHEIAKKEEASHILFSHDNIGKSTAPRVAVKCGASIVSGIIEIASVSSTESKVKKNAYSGKAIATIVNKNAKQVWTLMPNSFTIVPSKGSAEIISHSLSAKAKTELVEQKFEEGEAIPLQQAEVVVSAGRGLEDPKNWGMIEELAKELGAATACSRPVADMGWRPHHEHVGQTGTAIRPNVYFAIGISGATQHLAGVSGSKVIIVINKDPEAPFFNASDYGIVGDCFEVVPKLIELIKKNKS